MPRWVNNLCSERSERIQILGHLPKLGTIYWNPVSVFHVVDHHHMVPEKWFPKIWFLNHHMVPLYSFSIIIWFSIFWFPLNFSQSFYGYHIVVSISWFPLNFSQSFNGSIICFSIIIWFIKILVNYIFPRTIFQKSKNHFFPSYGSKHMVF